MSTQVPKSQLIKEEKRAKIEEKIATHQIEIEKAQKILDKQAHYSLIGHILLGISALALVIGIILLFIASRDLATVVLIAALTVLAISIVFQFLPQWAENKLCENMKQIRLLRLALLKTKSRHN